MGRIQLDFLDGTNVYTCDKCGSHLTTHNDLLSKVLKKRI